MHRMIGFAMAALCISAVVSPAHPATAVSKKMIAVLNLSSDDSVGDDQLVYMADRIRGSIRDAIDGDEWMVITRENMLVLQEANATDLAQCEDASCEVELGRRIGAHRIVAGNVVKFDQEFCCSLSSYDTVSSELLGTTEACAGEIKLLVDRIALAGASLVSGDRAGALPPGTVIGEVDAGASFDRGEDIVNQLTDETGFLFITATPSEARILVNGEEVGQGIVQLEKMVGHYIVVGELGSMYHPARAEFALDTDGTTVSLELKPAFGQLHLDSRPAGATVTLDGEEMGLTPYTNDKKRSGSYQLRLVLDNYFSHTETLEVRDEQTTARTVELEQNFGRLSVDSDPPGAAITLNGEASGHVTPHTFEVVQPGIAEVRLRLDGYGEAVRTTSVENRQTANLDIPLEAKLGILALMAETEQGVPCEGSVYLDGEAVGTTPLKLELPARTYELRVVCDGLEGNEPIKLVHNQKLTHTMTVEEQAGSIFFDSGFERYNDGHRLHDWGDNLVVVHDRSGNGVMTSQVPGTHAAEQEVRFPENFSFEYSWSSYDDRSTGTKAPHVRVLLQLIDEHGQPMTSECGNWGAQLPGSRNVDFNERSTNRYRLEKRGDTFTIFNNDQKLVSAQLTQFSRFAAFRIVVPVKSSGSGQRFWDFKGTNLGRL